MGGYGDDTFAFFLGDGADTVDETSSSSYDIVRFADQNITENDIAIFINGNGDLIIDYGSNSSEDVITVLSQTTNLYTDSSIEKLELINGLYIDNTDINQIIQDMTTYATENSIQMTDVTDVKANEDLMAIITNAWHA